MLTAVSFLCPDPIFDYPTLVLLSELPVDHIWFDLGLQLGLSLEVVKGIQIQVTPKCHGKIAMFRTARIKMSVLKYDTLIKAIFEVGEKKLSGKICTERGLCLDYIVAVSACNDSAAYVCNNHVTFAVKESG